MQRNRFYSYRGRTPWKRFLKIFMILILVLAVLAGAAALYLQRYLVVSSDGVRLDLPFLRPDDPSPTETVNIPDTPVVIVTPTPGPTSTPNSTSQPEVTEPPLPLAPVVFPAEGLYNAERTKEQITAAAGDCALFDMKDDEGVLNHHSPALARYSGRSLDSDGANESILALNSTEGLYTVARVSCFRDDYLFYYDSGYPLYANSGDRWIDSDRIHWLAPTSYDVRAYLTEVCVELAELGFDEILLDNAGYPTRGNTQYIRKGDAYNAAEFSTVIDNFYAQVISALAEYDVTVSVVTTQKALDGEDALSGQTPENLSRFDRLWIVDETGVLTPVQ